MYRALELVLRFFLPATVASIGIAEPIIRVLYKHGAFTSADMAATTSTLVAFAVGLPAFLAVKIFAPGFWAAQDTKTPFRIAVLCVIVNLFFNLTLSRPFAQVGMAAATTIASWLNLTVMMRILYRRGTFRPDALLTKRLTRMLGASLVMGLALYQSNAPLAGYYQQGALVRTVTLCAVILLGGLVYGAAAIGFGAYDHREIRKLFKRPAKIKPAK